MEWMMCVVATLFCLLGAVCLVSIIFSIPGGWIMLALACIIELCDQFYLAEGRQVTFGWIALGVSAALLGLSELIEFAAGAAGAKRGGAGKRGMVGALIGGILGAILFTIVVIIPVVGSLIGAIVGTFAGAVLGEITGANPKTVRGSVKPAIGATIGRVVGTMSKIGIALGVWIGLSVAAFWPG
jgi:uncharacterized protein YqgC (DUF456 family)